MKLSIIIIALFFSINTFAQDQFIAPKTKLLNDLAFTYGFVAAQKARVQKLSNTFPNLSSELNDAQLLWERIFQASVDSIGITIRSIYGNNFKASIDSGLNITLSKEAPTINETKDFITQIRNRSEGKMVSPIIETLLSYNPYFVKHPADEITSNFSKRYSSISNKDESFGIDIRMKLPQSWNSRDSQLPGIVKGFSNKNGRGTISVVVMLIDIKKEIDHDFKANLSDVVFNEVKLKTIVKNPRNIKRSRAFIYRNPCNRVEFIGEIQQLESLATVFQQTYYLIRNKKIFVLSFGVAQDSGESEAIFNQNITRNKPLFDLIASNLILVYPSN